MPRVVRERPPSSDSDGGFVRGQVDIRRFVRGPVVNKRRVEKVEDEATGWFEQPTLRNGVGLIVVVGWLFGVLFGVLFVEPPTASSSLPPVALRSHNTYWRPAPDAILERLPGDPGNAVFEASEPELEAAGGTLSGLLGRGKPRTRLIEYVHLESNRKRGDARGLDGLYRVEYAIDSQLNRQVFQILRNAQVKQGHVIVLDPATGRVLAYASTDPESFPPTRAYPSASIIKVITAAAVLELDPRAGSRTCRYEGSPYRLEPFQVYPPRYGRVVSFPRALATSNNQCFAQLAVNDVGRMGLLGAIDRFGFLDAAGPGHAPGTATPGQSDYDLGRLGCGLAGCNITPLHAAKLAATIATGESVEPWWIDRVLDSSGRELSLPVRSTPRRVMSAANAAQLRNMMVSTTTEGTARRAFNDRHGRPKLGSIQVAGKTGNLSGTTPTGRYEWFIGAAPAEAPKIAVAVVQVQGRSWIKKSSEIAVDVLADIFCDAGDCDAGNATRITGSL
jgi:hypothetical protein